MTEGRRRGRNDSNDHREFDGWSASDQWGHARDRCDIRRSDGTTHQPGEGGPLAKGSRTSVESATDTSARGAAGSRCAGNARTQLKEVGTSASATTTVQHPSGQVQRVAFVGDAGVGAGVRESSGVAMACDMACDIA